MRKAAALLIAAAAAFAFYRLVIVPWRCNDIEGIVKRATPERVERTDDPALRARAERNLAMIDECRRRCPADVNLAMLTAANLLILGRTAAAVPLYEEALRYDERPEIYLALAETQAMLGRRDEAIRNAIRGAEVVGVEELNGISDVIVRWRAYEVVGARQEKYLLETGLAKRPNVLANADFAEAGPRGAEVTQSGYGVVPSAARHWELLNPRGTSTTRIVPSPRRPGGKALHVSVAGVSGGLRQVWPNQLSLPRARTTAWVFVTRGRVALGSGSSAPMHDAVSTTTGRWEKLEALNQSCPAAMTMLQAVTEDGAEFVVDEVSAQYTLAAPPCEH